MAKSVSILGYGWLGQPLAHVLKKDGHAVIGSCRTPDKQTSLLQDGLEVVTLDLQESPFQSIPTSLVSVDTVIITIPFKRGLENPWHYTDQIKHIANACVAQDVSHIIMTSSTSVYPSTNDIVNEHSETDTTERAKALSAAEQHLLTHSAFDATILRFGGLFGPNRMPSRFFRHKDTIQGAQTPINLIHLDDCIRIIQSLLRISARNTIYNAVSPEHPTKQAFYQSQAKQDGVVLPPFTEPFIMPHKIVSAKKLCTELNYTFKIPLIN